MDIIKREFAGYPGTSVYNVQCATASILMALHKLTNVSTDHNDPRHSFRIAPKYRDEYSLRLRKQIADIVRTARRYDNMRDLVIGEFNVIEVHKNYVKFEYNPFASGFLACFIPNHALLYEAKDDVVTLVNHKANKDEI